jgi:hypothetical protein
MAKLRTSEQILRTRSASSAPIGMVLSPAEMLDLVGLMLILRPLELVTASIADDVGQRSVNLDMGCHMSKIRGLFTAVAPVAGQLNDLAVVLSPNVVIAYVILY